MGFTSMVVMMVMVMVMVVVVVVVKGIPTEPLQPVSYLGWKVLEVRLAEAEGATADSPKVDLNDLDDTTSVNILGQNRQTGVAEVAVSPSALPRFTQHLNDNKVPFSTVLEDLGRKINAARPNLRVADLQGGVTFSRFMTYEEILAHVNGLRDKHPTKVKVEVAGYSVENRSIPVITLTDDVDQSATFRRPVVFIDGGIHAREWISPITVLGIVKKLLATPRLTKRLEWRIMPQVNPDGYVASWEKDRLWRKNTAKAVGNVDSCRGVDLNRNFGYHWGEDGSSSNPCSTVYHGKSPFSEPESQAVRDALLREKDRTEAYITFHSYGQMILHPWGYTSRVLPYNNMELERVGKGMAEVIWKKQGVKYDVGSAAGILYSAAGGSDDWASGAANIPLSFTFELRDKGHGGFLLPDHQIEPTVRDAWLAMKYLANDILASPSKPVNLRQTGTEGTEDFQEGTGDFQTPVNQHQEPGSKNTGVENAGVVSVLETQTHHHNRNHVQETQVAMETEEIVEIRQGSSDVSYEISPQGDLNSPPQFSNSRFTSEVRDAAEPLDKASRSLEELGSFRHAPGGGVWLRILRGGVEGSSEEEAGGGGGGCD